MCLAIGQPCTPDRGCAVGECIAEFTGSIGEPGDEITMHPEGTTQITNTAWHGGYCTPGLPSAANPEPCDDGDPADTACGPCGQCLFAGTAASGERLTLCLANCEISLTDNGDCRDNYDCSLTGGFCQPGCESDDECRIVREDTNDDGEIDDGPLEGGVDRLLYLTASEKTCNPDTFRCDNPGTGGAEAGDTCVYDHECEEGGDCLGEAATGGGWPGGYCVKFGCGITGNECAGDGKCQERRIGIDLCVEPCMVAQSFVEDDTTTAADWIADTGGCRDGYACNWDGLSGRGVAGNGGCLPGQFNDITEPNIGAECDTDAEENVDCYSPFGLGFCSILSDDGYCLMLDCGAPGMPMDICGQNAMGVDNQCLDIDGTDGDLTACLQSCETAAECGTGMACVEFDGDESTPKICWPACLEDGDCRTGETCEIMPGDMTGECG